MPAKTLPTFIFALALITDSASADELLGNWQRGDLIFQETTGSEAEALKKATGSRLTHVGILRESGGEPYVVEATRSGDVYEIQIEDFLKRGVNQDYAIYRIKGLEPPSDWYHPLVLAAIDYFNFPYDAFYREDASEVYSSELIYLSAISLGIELGCFQRLGDILGDTDQAESFFRENWREHPDCLAAKLDREQCSALIMNQKIITPASIAKDDDLALVISTFGSPAHVDAKRSGDPVP